MIAMYHHQEVNEAIKEEQGVIPPLISSPRVNNLLYRYDVSPYHVQPITKRQM